MKLSVKNFRIFFAMKLTVKNFWICFAMNSAVKNFQFFFLKSTSLQKKFRKFLIVNFMLLKNFFTAEFIAKKFRKVLQSISLKKHFEIFSENPKKNFLPKKKEGSQGGNLQLFFQQNLTPLFVGFWCEDYNIFIFFNVLFFSNEVNRDFWWIKHWKNMSTKNYLSQIYWL